MPRRRSVAVVTLLVGGTIALWVWNLCYAPHLVIDDAFVFVRYARNLVEHGELAWNLGEPGTDGFTSLLYQCVAVAAYAIYRGDPLTALWYASVFASTAAMLTCLLFPLFEGRSLVERPKVILCALLGTLLTSAMSAQYAYWATSGMDASVLPFVVCLAAIGSGYLLGDTPQRPWPARWAGLSLALLFIARPEGIFVASIIGAIVGARAFRASRSELDTAEPLAQGLLSFVVPALACFGWHRWRFGYPFPNPVYVKSGLKLSLGGLLQGLGNLLKGPALGNLPSALVKVGDPSTRQLVKRALVQRAIVPDVAAWPSLFFLFAGLALFLFTAVRQGWRPSTNLFLRGYLLVPLGMTGLVVLGGCEDPHVGWRMLTPLLPAFALAVTLAVRSSPSVWFERAVCAVLLLLSARAVSFVPQRPQLCREGASSCGLEALTSMPTSLTHYAWDVTSSDDDSQLVRALKAAFPPRTVIAQSDFLRIAALTDFPVVDFSGLVNGPLAHSPHLPSFTLCTLDAWTETQPDIYFYRAEFVSDVRLSSLSIGSTEDIPQFRKAVTAWPPADLCWEWEEGTRADEATMRLLASTYVTASVALANGKYFNFFVHRRMLSQLKATPELTLGG